MSARPRILAFAYACEPDKGSEPAAGWIWSCMLARLGETIVLTRTNNREAIAEGLLRVPPDERPQFIYVDLPSWARRWKRGQRGIRVYYLLWYCAALVEARRLNRERQFDLVWHATLANAWLGSLAPLVGPPFVYGPVGGGVAMPWSLLPVIGVRGLVYELLRGTARSAGRYLNPVSRLAWRRATLILVQNVETRNWLPRHGRRKAVVFPNVVLTEHFGECVPRRKGTDRTALFAGRLLPWKGVALAIEAIARAPGWRLRICGAGPDAERLRRLADRSGVSSRVTFDGWLPRPELLRVMREDADVLLFPSLHEDAGWVVAESLGSGLRVVCLDRGGPPIISGNGGIAVRLKGHANAIAGQLAAILREEPLPSREVAYERAQQFQVAPRLAQLRAELEAVGLIDRGGGGEGSNADHKRLAATTWRYRGLQLP